jgi:hypothetical protein
MKRLASALVCVLALVAAAAVSRTLAAPPPPRAVPVIPGPIAPPPPPPPFPPPLPVRTPCDRVDEEATARWAHVEGGWSGGDGVLSVALRRKRTLWFFGDSIVSRRDGGGYAFVRNAAVEEEANGTLRTLAPTSDGKSLIGFPEPPAERWLWPGTAFTVGRHLWLFASEMRRSGSGFWGFRYVRSWLFELTLRSDRLVELRRVPLAADGVVWGASVIHADGWLYVFGVHDHTTFKHPHLARVSEADPLARWDYWSGTDWSGPPSTRGRWRGSVANEFTVVAAKTGVVLASVDPATQGTLSAYSAPSVVGPWTALGPVAVLPAGSGEFAYNALLHPRRKGRYLVSFNVAPRISHETDPLTRQALMPRFIDLDTGCFP